VLLRTGTDIPIYPVAFSGLEHFWPNIRRLRRTPVRVRVGDPFYLVPPAGRVRQAQRKEITTEVMAQIAALLPAESRGIYADKVGKTPIYLRTAQNITESRSA